MIDIDDLKRQQQQTKDNADYKEDIIEETIKTIKQIVAVSIYPKLQDQAFSDKISFELKERLRKKSNAMLELSFNIIPDKTMLDYAKKISIDKLLNNKTPELSNKNSVMKTPNVPFTCELEAYNMFNLENRVTMFFTAEFEIPVETLLMLWENGKYENEYIFEAFKLLIQQFADQNGLKYSYEYNKYRDYSNLILSL